MNNIVIPLLTTVAKLLGLGDTKAVIDENLLLKQQLLVVTRSRRRAPNLSTPDRFLMGFWSVFLRPDRIFKVAIGTGVALDRCNLVNKTKMRTFKDFVKRVPSIIHIKGA